MITVGVSSATSGAASRTGSSYGSGVGSSVTLFVVAGAGVTVSVVLVASEPSSSTL